MDSNGEFEKVKETLADDAVSRVTEVVQVVSWGIQQSNHDTCSSCNIKNVEVIELSKVCNSDNAFVLH